MKKRMAKKKKKKLQIIGKKIKITNYFIKYNIK